LKETITYVNISTRKEHRNDEQGDENEAGSAGKKPGAINVGRK
jgi:hypothetical protein